MIPTVPIGDFLTLFKSGTGQNPFSKTLLQVLYCKDFSELKFRGPGISHESRVESMSNVVLVVKDWEID